VQAEEAEDKRNFANLGTNDKAMSHLIRDQIKFKINELCEQRDGLKKA
jgi:hypothetical protein